MKILSPVGNFESLRAAVFGGADEVYLGINDFNARNNIDGFTIATLKEAVDFAHLFGVKVDLAINVLFADEELDRAIDIIVKAYQMGVDAFIIQDIALADILQNNYPQIEKHASTQMGIHNLEGVRAIERFGFKRVVLARETPLDEVKRIRENTDIEIEYFAHGALCVSFSGNCYLSSYLHSASGNRGRCKQLCRLPYTLYKGGNKVKSGYLLSAKDFNMLNRLNDLESAGVDVLKIEGRARRPFYVYTATKAYKMALEGRKIDVKELELAFNRTFTEGYFNGNKDIISKLQNHIGIEVGQVKKVNSGKKFNEIFFTSNTPISKKSTLKFFADGEERAVVSAFDVTNMGELYRLTTTAKVKVGYKVNLIADAEKETSVSSLSKKKKLKIKLLIKENQELLATFKVEDKEVQVSGAVTDIAKNRPLTEEELIDNFKKSEYFDSDLDIDIVGAPFVVKSELNEWRRRVLSKAFAELTKTNRQSISIEKIPAVKNANKFSDFKIVTSVLEVEGISQKNVVYSPEEYDEEDILKFKKTCENMNKHAYLDTPNFALKKDIEKLKGIIYNTKISIVANNYYAITLTDDFIVGGGLNVYNKRAAAVYDKPIISAESQVGERTDFPYMTLRHCPIKEHFGGECASCKYSNDFTLKSESGRVMKIKRKKLSTCTFYLTD